MPAKYNSELIDEKFETVKNKISDVRGEVKEVENEVTDLENLIKKEYTPLTTTSGIDKRVTKFEGIWDWGIKIILGSLIVGILALLGLK